MIELNDIRLYVKYLDYSVVRALMREGKFANCEPGGTGLIQSTDHRNKLKVQQKPITRVQAIGYIHPCRKRMKPASMGPALYADK